MLKASFRDWRLLAIPAFRLTAASAILSCVLFAPAAIGEAAEAQSMEAASDVYFPERRDWQARSPEQMGFDAALLEAAVEFAKSQESGAPNDLALNHELSSFGREPFGSRIGPTTVRAPLNGLVVKDGYIVAEWGQTRKVDMTFSVSKTFLSTTVGLAYDRGLVADVNDRAKYYMPTDEYFSGDHNGKITWDHLLRQTSDWSGTLWGKPDWADRPEGETPMDYPDRPMSEPGTRYKYNDVRVNLLALVATNVFREPLPKILREHVMNPIGASNTWRWHGYENSWVMIDGQNIQVVSGGGHWGGGMHINARDMARFGYLFLRKGAWGGKRIISEEWIDMARTPGTVNPGYGYMNWFLNRPYERDGEAFKAMPAAPDTAVTFRGAGSNIIYIDWENDLVVVVRWIQGRGFNEFIERVLGAMTSAPTTSN